VSVGSSRQSDDLLLMASVQSLHFSPRFLLNLSQSLSTILRDSQDFSLKPLTPRFFLRSALLLKLLDGFAVGRFLRRSSLQVAGSEQQFRKGQNSKRDTESKQDRHCSEPRVKMGVHILYGG
jgi:hypothetical protein